MNPTKKKEITFQAKMRQDTRKSARHTLRRTGYIPGNLYGAGEENRTIAVDKKSTELALKQITGHNVLANLVLEGSDEPIKTILKEVQQNPITGEVIHLDFYHIGKNRPVVLNVPLKFTGECPGVKEGGILQHNIWEVEVEGLPDRIPEAIEVDISSLTIGHSIQANTISLPEGIRLRTTADQVIVSVLAPKVEEAAPAAEAAAVPEEAAQPEVITQEIAEERRKEKESKKAEESTE
jgi:large subunit ribosomal protein L25